MLYRVPLLQIVKKVAKKTFLSDIEVLYWYKVTSLCLKEKIRKDDLSFLDLTDKSEVKGLFYSTALYVKDYSISRLENSKEASLILTCIKSHLEVKSCLKI